MRQPINDDLTNRGLEGWYEITGRKLSIYLQPTNTGLDWLLNLAAFPVPIDCLDLSKGFCHSGFKIMAYWLDGKIDTLIQIYGITEIRLSGFSMGGGVAQLAGLMWQQKSEVPCHILSIDGPRTTSRLPENLKLVYNRGSLVHDLPFWFPIAKDRECLNDKFEWFWISHGKYDIESLLKKAS